MFLLEFSQTRTAGSQKNNTIGSNLSGDDAKSDRLQKAIARNRAKQAKRSGGSTIIEDKKDFSENFQRESKPLSSEVTRRTVGTPDNIEFTNEIVPKKSKSTIGYSKAKRKVRTKGRGKKNAKNYSFLVKAAWIFCIFLLFRLIFSSGGVVDYYSSVEILEDKASEYKMIVKENEKLVNIIKKIRTNPRYQRKLVRDNLGFIAKDEYLILFPKKKISYSN